MNDNFDYENLNSIKISENYNNNNSLNNTKSVINNQAIKNKLSILENSIKTSNPFKKINNINLKREKNEYTNLNNKIRNSKSRAYDNHSFNNSIKLMDIKLNHQILQNKLENMRKTILKDDNSNYNTISYSNLFNSNPLDFDNEDNNLSFYKKISEQANVNKNPVDNFDHKNKENDFNVSNIKRNKVDQIRRNNYFEHDVCNTQTNEIRNSRYVNNKHNNLVDGDLKLNNLNKTIGTFNYDKNSFLSGFKINHNGLKFEYTKKDLAELEGKIQKTKERLNECLEKAETIIIEKKINNKRVKSEFDNKLQKNYRTLENVSGKYDRELYYNYKENKRNFYGKYDTENNSYEEELESPIQLKKGKFKDMNSYYNPSSRESFDESNKWEKLKTEESNSTLISKKLDKYQLPNDDDFHNNLYNEGKIKNKSKKTYDYQYESQIKDAYSNHSKSRRSKNIAKRKNQTNEEKFHNVKTTKTNANYESTYKMDSLIISESEKNNINSPENEKQNDNISEKYLNISGLAEDLISIKNENIKNKKTYFKNNVMNLENGNFNPDLNFGKGNSKVNDIYEKGIETYKKYLELKNDINDKIYSDKKQPYSTRNKQPGKLTNIGNEETLDKIHKNYTTKNLKDYDFQSSIAKNNNLPITFNQDTINIIENTISPIRYRENFIYNDKKGIPNHIFRNQENMNCLNNKQEKNKSEDFNISYNRNFRHTTIKDINQASEKQSDKEFDNELESKNFNLPNNQYYKYNNSNYLNSLENEFTPEQETHDKNKYNFMNNTNNKNQDIKDDLERENKIKNVFKKIPDLVSELTFKKERIKENIFSQKFEKKQFFNLNNLGKLLNQSKPPINHNNKFSNEISKAGKDLIDEADNIINNHFKERIKNNDFKENSADLEKQIEKIIIENEKKYNNDLFKINNSDAKFVQNNPSMRNEASSDSLNNKIDYIYDLLKNFSQSKLKDLILNPAKKHNTERSKEENQENKDKYISKYENNMNSSSNHEDYLNNFTRQNESEKRRNEESENKNLDFFDNEKLSFGMPKTSYILNQENNNFNPRNFQEKKKNEDIDASPHLLISPVSKSELDDFLKLSNLNNGKNNTKFNNDGENNLIQISNNFRKNKKNVKLNDGDLSEIKTIPSHSILKNQKNLIIKNNFKDFERSEENTKNNNILKNQTAEKIKRNQNIETSPDELEIENVNSNNYNMKNYSLNEKDDSQIIDDYELSSCNKKVVNISNNSNLGEESELGSISKKIDFSEKRNEEDEGYQNNEEDEIMDENEEYSNDQKNDKNQYDSDAHNGDSCEIYKIKQRNNNKKQSQEDSNCAHIKENSNNKEDISKEIDDIEDGIEQKDNSINEDSVSHSERKSNLKKNKEEIQYEENNKKENSKVKFLHSNSVKIINSNNFKDKSFGLINNDDLEEDPNLKQNKSDLDIEKELLNDKIKTNLSKDVIVDLPYPIKSKGNKIQFSDKLIFIEYDEETNPEEIKVYNQLGKPEKHNKFNLLKYLMHIKTKKYKTKKIIHYYYNGIRDDRLPKKLLSSIKRSKSFSEQDKVIGLQKLNEFLDECKKENQLSEVQEQKKKKIVERNFKTIQDIEEARKTAEIIKSMRSATPLKLNSHAGNVIKKYFSKIPANTFTKIFNIPNINSALKTSKSIGNFSEKIINKLNDKKKFSKLATIDKDTNYKKKNSDNNLHEFNLNSNSNKKTEKEKFLKNIISNLNLEKAMKSIEKESGNLIDDEILNNKESLQINNDHAEKKKK